MYTARTFLERFPGRVPSPVLWPEEEVDCPFCGAERALFAIPPGEAAKALAGNIQRLVTCGADSCMGQQKRILREMDIMWVR